MGKKNKKKSDEPYPDDNREARMRVINNRKDNNHNPTGKGSKLGVPGAVQRTGPKTFEGKLKNTLLSGAMKDGTHSKLMKLASQCKHCPLGERVETRTINGKSMTITIPAKCRYYDVTRTDCVYPATEQIDKLRTFYQVGEAQDAVELQRAIAYQSLMDAEMARKAEFLQDGRPGHHTHKFSELAMKGTESVIRGTVGEKRRLEANVRSDVAVLDINELLNKERESMDSGDEPYPWEDDDGDNKE